MKTHNPLLVGLRTHVLPYPSPQQALKARSIQNFRLQIGLAVDSAPGQAVAGSAFDCVLSKRSTKKRQKKGKWREGSITVVIRNYGETIGRGPRGVMYRDGCTMFKKKSIWDDLKKTGYGFPRT